MNQNRKKIIYGSLLTIALLFIIEHVIYYELELSELKTINGILERDPKFDQSKRGKYIELEIEEDEWRYQTSGIGYKALDESSVKENLKKGLPVTFLIAKNTGINEYLDGLVEVVDIYGLSSKGNTYLSLAEYNKGRKSNRYIGLFMWFVFFGIYIYSFWLEEKLKTRKINNNAL